LRPLGYFFMMRLSIVFSLFSSIVTSFFLLLGSSNHIWTFNICLSRFRDYLHYIIFFDDYHGHHLVPHLVDKSRCFVRELHYLKPSSFRIWVQAIVHLWNNAHNLNLQCWNWD
jgi:hypothetical protein